MDFKAENLTQNQKDLVIHLFSLPEYAGWRNIATKLVETGRCIVPGKESIWRGGAGNFIDTKPTEEAVDCLLYEFDLNNFMNSAYFKEYLEHFIEKSSKEADKAEADYLRANKKYKELLELKE